MNLRLDHIRKSYGGRSVLQDCSFVFSGTGIHVLMGPNGCGKSTLLRICALLEPPDGGSILFMDGERPLAVDLALRRRLTLVLPRTGVFNATVFNNVAYGLRLRGMTGPAVETKVRELLAFVGLEQRERQNARTLSSGETQRMGLARALAVCPDILFLDEPTASVDEANAEIIESIIRSLRDQGRTLVVMTTHDRDQSVRLADRHLTLRNGVLRSAGA